MRPDPNRLYRSDDVLQWEGPDRWELIDGRPYLMSGPSVLHQDLSMQLSLALSAPLRGGPCRLFAAPLDVKLSDHDLVQPDLLVVCDEQQNRGSHIEGPPAITIEIVSPSSFRHDRLRKLNLYARAGVPEFWLVTPQPFMIEVLSNRNSLFTIAGAYSETDTVRSVHIPELVVELPQVIAGLANPDAVREVETPYTLR